MMHMQASLLAALLVLAGLPNQLHGYPTFYHDRAHATTCTEHPAAPVGGHLPPITDKCVQAGNWTPQQCADARTRSSRRTARRPAAASAGAAMQSSPIRRNTAAVLLSITLDLSQQHVQQQPACVPSSLSAGVQRHAAHSSSGPLLAEHNNMLARRSTNCVCPCLFPCSCHMTRIMLRRDITVIASRKGAVVKDVCPGATYTLVTAFGGQERAALVTVSGGTVREANVAGW